MLLGLKSVLKVPQKLPVGTQVLQNACFSCLFAPYWYNLILCFSERVSGDFRQGEESQNIDVYSFFISCLFLVKFASGGFQGIACMYI